MLSLYLMFKSKKNDFNLYNLYNLANLDEYDYSSIWVTLKGRGLHYSTKFNLILKMFLFQNTHFTKFFFADLCCLKARWQNAGRNLLM